MCGIIGYVGSREPSQVILDGLARLEYRGYDSAGLALQNGTGLAIRKVSGPVEGLRQLMARKPTEATSGIGHTRWATHGPPTQCNAHPHTDCAREIAVVHNGIIENAEALRALLTTRGHRVETPTDTELLAHLIEEATGANLEERVALALSRVEGTYGLAVMASSEPDKIVVARRGSPVLIGIGAEDEYFVASDPSAILEYTRTVIYLEDGDLAVVQPGHVEVTDLNGRVQHRSEDELDWDLESIDLGEHRHFMLKEIVEQPEAVRNTLRGRLLQETGSARLDGLRLDETDIAGFRRIVVLGCGTSWHAGLVGRYILERLTGLPVQVEYASEFRYQTRLPLDGSLVIAISQSGETADTLEAIRAAQTAGARCVGLVNTVGSSIARETDGGIYLHAGPEIGVASTKAFTCQLTALLLLGLHLGRARGLWMEEGQDLARQLADLPNLIRRTLAVEPDVRDLAEIYADAENFLYLGRGVSFPVALEGALKLKEVSYIHAEGYPAAEMKHGPIALIDEDMPVVFVAPCDSSYRKVLSNIQEVKARGGRIIVVTTEGSGDLAGLADHVIRVPRVSALLSPVLTVIPLQLLAYHVAVLRGLDVDRPRNLAKSVTVE
jgi:glucosamine--fructose-6-phosphate aminotransferase (isomerizing)